MGLFDKLKSAFSDTPSGSAKPQKPPSAAQGPGWRSVLTKIGTAAPCCPYCGHTFDRMPQRKRKCPQCQGVFYSRKRAIDRVKVLLTETQARDGEAQAALLTLVQENGPEDDELDRLTRRLNDQSHRLPTADELVEEYLQTLALTHAESWKWGLYRNARFGIAESYRRRGLLDDALRLLLEVNLIDLNGPRNLGTKDPAIVRRFPPFDPSTGFLAGGIISRTVEIMGALDVSLQDVRALFESVAKEVKAPLGLPRSAESCWEELSKALAEARS